MKTKNKIWINLLVLIGAFSIIAYSCKKDDQIAIPILKTNTFVDVAIFSASCIGQVSDCRLPIITRGICWSTTSTPTIADNKVLDGCMNSEIFTCILTKLSPNTIYFARAFATSSEGTGYGNIISFTTKSSEILFNPNLTYGAVSDIDGNVYKTITIGTQTWMAENLRVTHYRNGDPIPYVADSIEWQKNTSGAYSCYHNTPENSSVYGNIYRGFAVVDIRGICPAGWHIPSDAEWETFKKNVGNHVEMLKAKGGKHWQDANTDANNGYGFTAMPSGMRFSRGFWAFSGFGCFYWSSTMQTDSFINGNRIVTEENSITSFPYKLNYGLSVRCIKD